jgi:hypothetical protein
LRLKHQRQLDDRADRLIYNPESSKRSKPLYNEPIIYINCLLPYKAKRRNLDHGLSTGNGYAKFDGDWKVNMVIEDRIEWEESQVADLSVKPAFNNADLRHKTGSRILSRNDYVSITNILGIDRGFLQDYGEYMANLKNLNAGTISIPVDRTAPGFGRNLGNARVGDGYDGEESEDEKSEDEEFEDEEPSEEEPELRFDPTPFEFMRRGNLAQLNATDKAKFFEGLFKFMGL